MIEYAQSSGKVYRARITKPYADIFMLLGITLQKHRFQFGRSCLTDTFFQPWNTNAYIFFSPDLQMLIMLAKKNRNCSFSCIICSFRYCSKLQKAATSTINFHKSETKFQAYTNTENTTFILNFKCIFISVSNTLYVPQENLDIVYFKLDIYFHMLIVTYFPCLISKDFMSCTSFI